MSDTPETIYKQLRDTAPLLRLNCRPAAGFLMHDAADMIARLTAERDAAVARVRALESASNGQNEAIAAAFPDPVQACKAQDLVRPILARAEKAEAEAKRWEQSFLTEHQACVSIHKDLDGQIDAATARAEKAERERDEARDLLMDCAGQFLIDNDDGTLTHSCMSTEEALCDYLVRVGRLVEVRPGVFRWPPQPAVPVPATAKAEARPALRWHSDDCIQPFHRYCTACGAAVLWSKRLGNSIPVQYHDCKRPGAGWSDEPVKPPDSLNQPPDGFMFLPRAGEARP